MVSTWRAVWVVPLAIALMTLVPTTPAQVQTCGETGLTFLNPDLQPTQDGVIQASGGCFAQVEPLREVGVSVVALSIGKDAPGGAASCTTPIWFSGPYALNFRADRNGSDGFFIPFNTSDFPDGTYNLALHAYNSSNAEVGRTWFELVIENCSSTTGTITGCAGDEEELKQADKTLPWPILLPVDGKLAAGVPNGTLLSMEFPEPVRDVRLRINGTDVTHALGGWEGRPMDDDNTPDYGPPGIGDGVSEPCTQDFQSCRVWGPAWTWNGSGVLPNMTRLGGGVLVQVEATDRSGNTVSKEARIGTAPAGGHLPVPHLRMQVDAITKEIDRDAEEVTFAFRFQNDGDGEAEVETEVHGPSNWGVQVDPDPLRVPPQESRTQNVTFVAPFSPPATTHNVTLTYRYDTGGATNLLRQELQFAVVAPEEEEEQGIPPGPLEGGAQVGGGKEETPPPAVGLLAATLVGTAWTIRRRT